ncbi:Oidioi.mRNA.OKI2018_I69.XSR.g15204.t1.cds [Oikopleura dioica]|uniref:Oidioi.mRNA.OKI2018_I69.XSR.g15204.t1.cds n=1 Tax=Oikopleura dioica TaxID=34765 RepID=A0ABN7SC39_OIKDI|nr:Oidioi.mRNA.OKI2018_I69.XSR.g15204.t1.cds [Oikopleura dioica]
MERPQNRQSESSNEAANSPSNRPDNDQLYWAKIFGGAAPSHSNSGRKKSMKRADELSRSEKRKDSLTSNDVDAHTKWLLLQNIQNQGGFIEKSAQQNPHSSKT